MRGRSARTRRASDGASHHGFPAPVFVAYAAVGAVGLLVGEARGVAVVRRSAWLDALVPHAAPWVDPMVSVALGVAVAVATIAATVALERRSASLRALHASLRPAAVGASDARLLAVALAGGLAEELLFRGALVPVLGIVGSSLLFGALHQVRGEGRWIWVASSTLVGLAFACVFALTGCLEGAVVAHVVINGVNLRYLRDHVPVPVPVPVHEPEPEPVHVAAEPDARRGLLRFRS